MWAEVSSSPNKCKISTSDFWDGVKVWIERPHILDPRIFGVEVKHSWKIKWKQDKVPKTEVLETHTVITLLANSVSFKDVELLNYLQSFLETVPCENVFEYMKAAEGPERLSSDLVLQISELLPKQPKKHLPSLQVLIFDKKACSVVFVCYVDEANGLCIPFPYRFSCADGRIRFCVPKKVLSCEKHMNGPGKWLRDVIFPKVAHWCVKIPGVPAVPSLLVVPVSRYSANYHRLKAKYGKKMVEVWPECTDPLKYVYEDIGIAAYLITLWEEERKTQWSNTMQTFVDLGCGNGLLVYILTSEGHKGYGIDVRKRAIWDCYGPETKLVELALTPSDKMLFPDYDWIIGNHSDELTPWIPVIAARSSYRARAFVLPCCLYTFDGKYHRPHADKSAYQSYLDFINQVCVNMGFHVKLDKLRIASVKRICFLCVGRNYPPKDESLIDKKRTEFIQVNSVRSSRGNPNNQPSAENLESPESNESQAANKDLNQNERGSTTDCCVQKWAACFLPRERKIKVQNCTNLEPEVLNNLIAEIMKYLLQLDENLIVVDKDGEKVVWNAGGNITLEELAKALNPASLSKLKHQCGGLQTLVRNHRNIFTIDKGKVSLTVPFLKGPELTVPKKKAKRSKMKKKKKKKQNSNDPRQSKPCYFHLFHPNGCPWSSHDCSFAH